MRLFTTTSPSLCTRPPRGHHCVGTNSAGYPEEWKPPPDDKYARPIRYQLLVQAIPFKFTSRQLISAVAIPKFGIASFSYSLLPLAHEGAKASHESKQSTPAPSRVALRWLKSEKMGMSMDTGTDVGASVDLTSLLGSECPWLVTTWRGGDHTDGSCLMTDESKTTAWNVMADDERAGGPAPATLGLGFPFPRGADEQTWTGWLSV